MHPLLAAAAEIRAAATGNPTTEIGSVLPERAFSSSMIPGWTLFEAQARIIPVDALKWPRSNRTYEDMRRDPQIQGLLQSFWLPIRQFEWYVDPEGTTGTVAEEIARDFGLPLLNEEAPDETQGIDFDDHLRVALLATAGGHRFFEEAGELDSDGKFRLTSLHQRPPHTISRMNIDPDGSLISVQQYGSLPPPVIPYDRLLTYVWDREGANWAGRPLLYGLYRPWLLKDELIRGDATTHRRFAGVPYTKQTQPGVVDSGAAGTAAAAMQALRSGDTSGMHFPYGVEPGILSGDAGTSAINSAEYHDRQMSRAFMQMFADLGSTPHGSRALGTTLLDHFTLGVFTVANWLRKSTMVAVRREVTRNYGPDTKAPSIRFREERAQELTPEQLVAMVEAGIIQADDELEKAVRTNGSLPERNESEAARPLPKAPPITNVQASAPEIVKAAYNPDEKRGHHGEWTKGSIVHFVKGIDAKSGKVLEGHQKGRVARSNDSGALMVNAGTDKKPHFVQTHVDHLVAAAQKKTSEGLGRKGYRSRLTASESKALDEYKANGYRQLNSTLRSDKPLGSTLKARSDAIDTAITKGELTKDTRLHRAFRPTGGLHLMEGDVVHDDAYVSTSMHEKTPLEIAGAHRRKGEPFYVAHITAPKGTNVAYPDAAGSIAHGLSHEDEIILPRGQAFHVKSIKTDKNGQQHVELEPTVGTPDANVGQDEGKLVSTIRAAPTPVRASAAKANGTDVESQTDFAGLQRTHEAALANLTAMWTGVQAAQIADLAQQIRDGAELATLAPFVIGGVQLAKALDGVVEHGAQTVTDAASAQGHVLPAPELATAKQTLADAAQGTATMLAQALGQSAASKATGLSGLPNDEIASQVSDYLHGLSGVTPEYELAGLASQAQNEGRFAAMEAAPHGTRYYSAELNDTNTCDACEHEDGDQFSSLADARRDYPAGGYVACAGGKRCRGTVVAVYPETPGQARS